MVGMPGAVGVGEGGGGGAGPGPSLLASWWHLGELEPGKAWKWGVVAL